VGGPRFLVYASTETHRSVEKALELLGFGRSGYRRIPVGPDSRIDIGMLREAIGADREAGDHPLCLVGNVGTVNTGAIDPLEDLVTVARDEGLWLHLDGAFGAVGYLVPHLRTPLAKLPEADSLTIDLHKWFYLPFDVSILLVRQAVVLEDAYRSSADYLSKTDQGPASPTVAFSDRGIEQSRRFRALKVWFAMKTHGLDAFAAAVAENVTQVEHLNALVAGSPHLESVSTSPLNVSCFRYIWPEATSAELNRANQEILRRLQVSGLAMPSHTMLDGKFVIRVAHTNHRTLPSDFDFLIDQVLSIGAQVTGAPAV
jgi:aromatic-L-amino-acid/L-tryptophan decarboxylase